MPSYCSIYDTTENKEGDYFEEVFFNFISGDSIRNLGWSKGVYAKLKPAAGVVTLYYADENSDKLNHENDIDCFSIKDLASHDWVVARLPHEYPS